MTVRCGGIGEVPSDANGQPDGHGHGNGFRFSSTLCRGIKLGVRQLRGRKMLW